MIIEDYDSSFWTSSETSDNCEQDGLSADVVENEESKLDLELNDTVKVAINLRNSNSFMGIKDSEFTANGHILDEFCNDEEVDNEDLIEDESAMNAVFVYKLMQ